MMIADLNQQLITNNNLKMKTMVRPTTLCSRVTQTKVAIDVSITRNVFLREKSTNG